MTSPAELFRLGLLALLAGVALPLFVQLFLVLRNVQRVTAVLDRRLDGTLHALEDVAAVVKRGDAAPAAWPSAAAAMVSAAIAAARAFRTGIAHDHDVADAAPTHNNHAEEKRT
jgi:hypothetical protein